MPKKKNPLVVACSLQIRPSTHAHAKPNKRKLKKNPRWNRTFFPGKSYPMAKRNGNICIPSLYRRRDHCHYYHHIICRYRQRVIMLVNLLSPSLQNGGIFFVMLSVGTPMSVCCCRYYLIIVNRRCRYHLYSRFKRIGAFKKQVKK